MTFTPTVDATNRIPTTCYCCGRHAAATGIGSFKSDPLYLCEQCLMILESIKAVRRFDQFEVAAIEYAIDQAGEMIDQFGTSELGDFTDQQRFDFVKGIWAACGDGLRAAVKAQGAPF